MPERTIRQVCIDIIKSCLGEVDNALLADALDLHQLHLDSLDMVDIQQQLEEYYDIDLGTYHQFGEDTLSLDAMVNKVNSAMPHEVSAPIMYG
jgi:acyl carrier protein